MFVDHLPARFHRRPKIHLFVNNERQGEFPTYAQIGRGDRAQQSHRQTGEQRGDEGIHRLLVRRGPRLQMAELADLRKNRQKFNQQNNQERNHARHHQQTLDKRAEKKLAERPAKSGEHIPDLRRFLAVDADEKVKQAAHQRPGADKVRDGKNRADNRNVAQSADGHFNQQIKQRGDEQPVHVVFHQLPAVRDAADEIEFVIAFAKIGGRFQRRDNAWSVRGERIGEFRKFLQRTEFRVALRLDERLRGEPPLGKPLPHVVRCDRAVFLAVAADDDVVRHKFLPVWFFSSVLKPTYKAGNLLILILIVILISQSQNYDYDIG